MSKVRNMARENQGFAREALVGRHELPTATEAKAKRCCGGWEYVRLGGFAKEILIGQQEFPNDKLGEVRKFMSSNMNYP